MVWVIVSSCCRIGDLVGLESTDVLDDGFISRKGKTGELRYYCEPKLYEAMRNLAGEDGFVFKGVRDTGEVGEGWCFSSTSS